MCTPQSRKVSSVGVLFPKDKIWSSLKSDYESCKEQYIRKYGPPENSIETFREPYYEGDGFELQAFRQGKAAFVTKWALQTGAIYVSIKEDQLLILYEDAQNSKIGEEEENQQIQDEI